MAVRVVFDGPPRRGLGGVGRGLVVLFGSVLLILGMTSLGVLALVVLALVAGGSSGADRNGALATGAVALVAATISLLLAVRLLRGRRRLVLFLRRFGFDDATSTVTFAAARVIGRSWRLVTLDDSRVQPLGGSSGPRRLLALIGLVTVVPLVVGGVWLAGGGPGRFIDRIIAGMEVEGGATDLGSEVVRVFAGAVVAGLLLFLLLIAAIVVAVSSLFSTAAYGAAMRAERAKSALIQTPTDVRRGSAKVDRRSGRIFAPRLVVVRVADPVWQASVSEFAGLSDAILVDVSQPSDNLLWELNTLLPIMGNRCILVGRRDLLADATSDERTGFNPALAKLLDGRTVLAYGTTKTEIHRFARALEAFLTETTRT